MQGVASRDQELRQSEGRVRRESQANRRYLVLRALPTSRGSRIAGLFKDTADAETVAGSPTSSNLRWPSVARSRRRRCP